ncbi:MAG: hypothetical protein ABL309_02300 [Phycisphaerales bacterium]
MNSADTSAIMFALGCEADLDVSVDGSVDTMDSSLVSKLSGRSLADGQLSDTGNIVGWCDYLYEEASLLKRRHVAGASPLADPQNDNRPEAIRGRLSDWK